MTGPYAIDAPCTVTEGPCNVVLTIDSSKNSAAEIATAIGATLKFGNNNHGQYWYNDLQWAYYYTFFSGKGGSPGNYTAYDPKTMLPDQTPITGNSMTLAQDDMATSIARYLTDPATFKAQDPARYAFIDAVYKGYNPTDIQLVNNGQIVDTSKLDSTAIIQNIPTISATQQDTLMKMGWNNIPADIAANNAGPNDSWKNAVIAASQKYNVPISVIVGVMQIESGGQNGRLTLKGSSGEIGLMQITPDKTSFSKSELMTAQGNISAGAQFLRTLYDDPTLGNGNWRDTLALYNGGRYGWDGLINKPSLSQGAFNYADTVLKDGGVSTDQVKTNIPTSSTTTTLKTTAKAVPGPSQPNQPNVIAQTFNNVTSNAQRAILYPIKPFQNAINNIVDLATGDQTIQTLFYGGLAPQAGNSTVAITGTVQNINPQVPAQQPGTTQVTQIGNPSQTSQLQNFPIFLQYGYNDSLEINNYGGTLLKWGCGPSTAYNILKLEGYNVTFQKVLDTYLWTSIGSDGPSVLLDLRRNGFPPNTVEYGTDPNNIITDAKELANYNGLLVYSGKTNGKDHIAAFSCNQGDCYSIDSYFSQGNPIKCKIESTVRVNCGGVKYKVGESGGTPYAFYPVIQP